MNKKLLKLSALLASTLLLAACEETIPADKRYSPIANEPPRRAVLVEEYTGTSCINCPNGHKTLESIEELYNTPANLEQGIGVIAVGIHIPNYGIPAAIGGLISAEAASLTPEAVSPPQARVNRVTGVLDIADWPKHIKDLITMPAKVTFDRSLTAELAENNVVTISGEVTSQDNFSKARLHVWMVEDSIVMRQSQPDGSVDRQYMHMNVFRGSVTPVNGSEFGMQRNSTRSFSLSYPLDAKWKPEHLRVVAFIETETDGVLNATQNFVQINQ